MKTKSFLFTLLCCILVGLSVKVFAITKQDRNVGVFTKVSVSNGIDLYLTQGNTHSVAIETDEDIIDKIETVVENGTLSIKVKKGEKINWKNGKLILKAYVTTPTIEAIRGSGGSDIYPQTTINSNGFLEIALSGGSDLKGGTMKAKQVNLKLSGGSDAKLLAVTADTFIAHISGGSDLEGSVTAPAIDLKQSGGSDSKLTVNTTNLSVANSGGSDVSVSGKTHTIIAKASGASDINATNLSYESSDISKSGGSDIRLKK